MTDFHSVAQWVMMAQGLMVALALLLIVVPVQSYLAKGWAARRREIVEGMSEDACVRYFLMYRRNGNDAAGSAAAEFARLHDNWYGRRAFVPALALLMMTIGAVAVAITATVPASLGYANPPSFPLPLSCVAALAGAYMWVANDIVARSRRLDLQQSDFLWAALRMIIAIPMGLAFASIAAPGVAPFVAFALGAFPLGALSTMLQRASTKALSIDVPSSDATESLTVLNGVNSAVAERLAEENIGTVLQMAYGDPVHLAMRSNLSFVVVTHLMGQALLHVYLGSNALKLAPLGFGTALDVKHLIDSLDSGAGRCGPLAVPLLQQVASACGTQASAAEFLLRQIATDPYTVFLSELQLPEPTVIVACAR